MLQGAAQPVEFGHHDLIPSAIRREQRPVQLGSARQLPRDHVEVDLIAPDGHKRVVLGVGMLVAGRDPAVANLHHRKCIANPRHGDIAADTASVAQPTRMNTSLARKSHEPTFPDTAAVTRIVPRVVITGAESVGMAHHGHGR